MSGGWAPPPSDKPLPPPPNVGSGASKPPAVANMTLRDHFAEQIFLASMDTLFRAANFKECAKSIATAAYFAADAMMNARSKQP